MLKLKIKTEARALLIIPFTLIIFPASVSASSISHSFQPEGAISSGELVSLDPDHNNAVQLANSMNSIHLLGVATSQNASLVAINSSNSLIQVALSGTAPVLVSNLNGPIKAGDLISVSPVNGIGMKAEAGLFTIGQAEASFSASTSGSVTEAITTKRGKEAYIKVGYINVALNVGKVSGGNKAQINSLQNIVKDLTGHVVSTLRIIISLTVAAIALVSLAGLMYGAIYGGIISIGRNPLAKFSVLRSLRFVLALGLAIVGVSGLFIVLLLY